MRHDGSVLLMSSGNFALFVSSQFSLSLSLSPVQCPPLGLLSSLSLSLSRLSRCASSSTRHRIHVSRNLIGNSTVPTMGYPKVPPGTGCFRRWVGWASTRPRRGSPAGRIARSRGVCCSASLCPLSEICMHACMHSWVTKPNHTLCIRYCIVPLINQIPHWYM